MQLFTVSKSDVYAERGTPALSTPARPAPAPLSTTAAAPTPAPSRLEALHLAAYAWIDSLLAPDSDAVNLPPTSNNNQTVVLELTKDTAVS